MSATDTHLMINNANIARRNAGISDWNAQVASTNAQLAEENAEIAARQVMIKNYALRELARLDPNNWLFKQDMRNKAGDEGVAFYRKTGQLPPLPPEVKNATR